MVPIQGLGGVGPAGRPEGSQDTPPAGSAQANGGSAGAPQGADRAEISDRGLALIALKSIPATRADLVEALKAAIQAGKYSLPEALDGAAPDLAEDV